MSHLDEGTIHAWLDGALSPDESARVEGHSKECAECAALVAEARGFIAGASRIVSSLDVVRGNVIPAAVAGPARTSPRGSLWKTLKLTPVRAAIAATILVGVASMFTLRQQNVEVVSSEKLMDTAASLPVALAPAAPPAPTQPSADAAASAKREAAAQSNSVEAMKARSLAAAPPAPAAAPPAVARPVLPQRSTMQLSEVVVTGASTARRDSSAAAGSAPARAARAKQGADARDAVGRVARGVAGASPEAALAQVLGCYRLQFDSPVDLHGFPNPFQLAHDSIGGVNAVQVPNAGRDSVLSGASWRMMLMSVVISAGDAAANPVRLLFDPDSLRATFSATGVRTTARVERMSCPR
jgi:hypothetical protein